MDMDMHQPAVIEQSSQPTNQPLASSVRIVVTGGNGGGMAFRFFCWLLYFLVTYGSWGGGGICWVVGRRQFGSKVDASSMYLCMYIYLYIQVWHISTVLYSPFYTRIFLWDGNR